MSNIHHLRQPVRRIPIALPEPAAPVAPPAEFKIAVACVAIGFATGVLWTVLFELLV